MTKKKAKSKTKALAVKGQVLPPEKYDSKTRARAMKLHAEILDDVRSAESCFVRLAAKLAKMKTEHLWAAVIDQEHKGGYSDWDSYKHSVLGKMGKSKFYELIAVHELTQGPSPMAASAIKQMGIKRAYEVARLEPSQRSPEIILAAQTKPLAEVKAMVQGVINEDLPKDRQKEPSVAFVRMLPTWIIAEYEELEEDGEFLDVVLDGDPKLNKQQKFFHALISDFRDHNREELMQARERRLAEEKIPEAVHETDAWAGKQKALTAHA